MSQVIEVIRSISGVLVTLAVLSICSQCSLADPPVSPLNSLEKQQISIALRKRTPAQVIEALSLQVDRPILVDSDPKVKEVDLEFAGSAKQGLDRCAALLGCTWTINKRGVILLQKQFRDTEDLPQIHLKEMRKMAQDLLAIWPANTSTERNWYYPFEYIRIWPAKALYNSLTIDQRQAIRAGQVLPYDALSQDQQSLLRLGIYNKVVHNSRDIWQKLSDRISGLSDKGYMIWRAANPQRPVAGLSRLDYVWAPFSPTTLEPYGRSFVKIAGSQQLDENQKKENK